MKDFSFEFELQSMLTQFCAAIDDIVIGRYDNNRIIRDRIAVRTVYAPKQRVLADLLDKAQNIQLPVVACYVSSITRDPSRAWNKINGSYIPSSDPGYTTLQRQPVPIDVGVNVSVLTRYQLDIDEILNNILSNINPYFVISWRTVSAPSQEIRSQVIWGGSVNIQYPYDIASTVVARVHADLSFTIKGWMFHTPSPGSGDAKIFKINTSFSINVDEQGSYTLPGYDRGYSTDVTDFFAMSAVPQPTSLSPTYYILSADTTPVIEVRGRSFFGIDSVYLSGAALAPYQTFYSPFSAATSLSSIYTGFSAVPVGSFTSNNVDSVIFTVPDALYNTTQALALSGQYLDVVTVNDAGYSTFIASAQKEFSSHYTHLSGLSASYSPAWLPGIEVKQPAQ